MNPMAMDKEQRYKSGLQEKKRSYALFKNKHLFYDGISHKNPPSMCHLIGVHENLKVYLQDFFLAVLVCLGRVFSQWELLQV